MLRKKILLLFCISFFLAGFFETNIARAYVKGIYITSGTARNDNKMDYLIERAKRSGINAFVIDVYGAHNNYTRNVAKVRKAGIRYVARVVMFPHGAKGIGQIADKKIWQHRWQWAQYAISLGADTIQLDYIRYHHSQPASVENEKKVYTVIQHFRDKLKGTKVKLEIDIFGVVAHRPTRTIGQNIVLFAPSLDAVNPMVYPSHYYPASYHSERPYNTVFNSVSALKKQLQPFPQVKVHAFIEVFNYLYPMSYNKRSEYVKAQIRGALDAGSDGWYAWSANNRYNLLFDILESKKHASLSSQTTLEKN